MEKNDLSSYSLDFYDWTKTNTRNDENIAKHFARVEQT